ncbi:MAG TPA: Lrp/AsnC family transcriptional regulator [Ramlibacter sp.]|nr:Lrp/AsnC family transcriptional regulator [Ramlibacter sp.]
MHTTMDGKDRLLIAYLRRNARMTAVELAGRLDLSRSSVQARMSRLERIGIIRGYTVVLGEEAANDALRSWFVIKLAKGTGTDSLLELIRAVRGVGAVYLLTGEVDLLVEVQCAGIAGIDQARLQISSLEGVTDIRTHVVLRASGADAVAPNTQVPDAVIEAGMRTA